ncbi:hypothetical protein [Micromonospora sp. NPDC004704]
MTMTTFGRIDTKTGSGAYPVITDGPLKDGAVAHRPENAISKVPAGHTLLDGTQVMRDVHITRPRCYADDQGEQVDARAPRYSAVSAAWADLQGAVACLTCFPEA